MENLRNRISLKALAEEAGARFDNPHRLSSRCPLPRHAGDRSSRAFTIYENSRKWKCHSSCPADANGGDVVDFYRFWKGVDFKTAVAELSQRVGLGTQSPRPGPQPAPVSTVIPPPAVLNLAWHERAEQFVAWAESKLASDVGARAREYLEKERGLNPETWQAFRLGFNPTNLYDNPARWGLDGKKIWLPRGIVIPGIWQKQPWYIKVRRPQPEDSLGEYIGLWSKGDGAPEIKFGGPRGGRAVLFQLEFRDHFPVLALTEGEWDAMLLYENCIGLADVGTLGGAKAHFDSLDLALLTRYLAVLVIHDNDRAGEQGREYIQQLNASSSRIIPVQPPAHDLTDFWKSGGDLESWIARHIANALDDALKGITDLSPVVDRWRWIAYLAKCRASHHNLRACDAS